MSAPVRVLCVDDNDLVCEALHRKFSGMEEFVWCGALPDASQLTAAALERRADVVLLDLDMPGPDPLGQTRVLAESAPKCRVIVLSGMLTDALVEKAFDAGVWGYLSKAESSAEIIDAVRRVAAGEVVLGREVLMCANARPAVGTRR